MNPSELVFGILLVVVLLFLAGYFAWRQKNTLRSLRQPDFLNPEDRLYVRKQVRRRLLSSVLMVVFAAMLVGWFFLEGHLRPPLPNPQMDPEELEAERNNIIRMITLYWIGALFVLFAIVFLAAMDFLATARFGLRHQRQLEAERRAVLESQASRLRQERNGHS